MIWQWLKGIAWSTVFVAGAQIATAVATAILACAAYRQIETMNIVSRESQRPWLNVKIVDQTIDPASFKAEITIEVRALENRSPAKFIRCYRGSLSPNKLGENEIPFPTNVLLPGELLTKDKYPVFQQPEDSDLVFKHRKESRINIGCRYGMTIQNEFQTEKTFLLGTDRKKYEELQSATVFR